MNALGNLSKDISGIWMGVIVSFDSQKEQVSGLGWGWRYKVRKLGEDSNDNQIEDSNLIYALCLLGPSDGTGGGGRFRSVRYTQGDIVLGFHLQTTPVILGAIPRTSGVKYTGRTDKFGPKSGHTKALKPGLLKAQQANENDGPNTPQLKPQKKNNGTNQQRETPKDKLQQQMGINPDGENEVGVIEKPPERNADLTTYDKLGPDSDILYIGKDGKTKYQRGLERLGASPEEAEKEATRLRAETLANNVIARDYSPQEKAEDKLLLRSIQRGELGPVPQEQIDQIINRINGVGVRQA